MADFATTIAHTAERLITLIQHADQSHGNLSELHQHVTTASSQIDSDWHDLHTHAESLLQHMQAAKTELSTEATQLHQILQQLKGKVEHLYADFQHDVADTKDTIAHFNQHVDSLMPELEKSAHEVETVLTDLKTKAGEIETGLSASVTQVENYLQHDFSSDLHTLHTDIEHHATELNNFLSHNLSSHLTTKVGEVEHHIDNAIHQLTQQVNDCLEQIEHSAKDSLDCTKQNQEHHVQGWLHTAQQLEHDMGTVKDAIHSLDEHYTRDKELLQEGCQLTNHGFNVAVGILHEWNQLLERFV
jgi:chromosome segregation ATPase